MILAILVGCAGISDSCCDVARPDVASRSSASKGLVLSLVSGFFMGSFYPLVEMSREGEIGLGPYTAGRDVRRSACSSPRSYSTYTS